MSDTKEIEILDEDDAVIEVQTLLQKMANVVITTDQEYAEIGAFIVRAQETKRIVEKVFEAELSAAQEEKRVAEAKRKAIDLRIRAITDKLDDAKAAAQKVMAGYQQAKRVAAEAAEKARLLEEAKVEAERVAALPKGVQEPAVVPTPEIVSAPVSAATPEVPKVAGLREETIYDWELVDISKVPEKYLTLNVAAINQDVKALKDLFHVPGLKLNKSTRMVPTGR